MKIFDFSNGVKGAYLGDTTWSGSGGWWLNGKRIEKNSVQIGRYTFCEFLYGPKSEKVLPEKFNVQAICFCQAFKNNYGETVYEWYYTASKDWLDKNTKWKWDDKANQENKQGMIDDLMECVAFEEDSMIERALSKYNSMSYEEVKKQWLELKQG